MKLISVRFYQSVPVSRSNKLETFITTANNTYGGLTIDAEKGVIEFKTADMDRPRCVPYTNVMYFEKDDAK